MNSLQSWFRASWLLALFVIVGLIGALALAFSTVADWFSAPEREKRDPIITPLKDEEVPTHLQPIVAAWRKMAEWFGYKGPVVWLFRGGVTLKELATEYGHARILKRIFSSWLEGPPMFVFWIPCLQKITSGYHDHASEQRVYMNTLHQDHFSMPRSHDLSFGSDLALYILMLHNKRLIGQYFLPQNEVEAGWLIRTDSFRNGKRVHIDLSNWVGLSLDFNGDVEADKGLTRYFALGSEPANNFSLKRAA